MAQRQFRSDDTSVWSDRYGSGSDGAKTISVDTTDAPINSACSGNASATTLTATNGSFAAGQLLIIHQSRGSGVGAWELNKIDSYVAGTITLVYPLINTYTSSGASLAQVQVMPSYTSVTVNTGVTWTSSNFGGGVDGILAFFCTGTTNIVGAINSASKGYDGGAGDTSSGAYRGEGTAGDQNTKQGGANGNGGGGGSGGGGGGGGHGTAGSNSSGTGGNAVGDSNLLSLNFGGGGGGGENGAGGSAGGSGGGIILIFSKNIVFSGTASAGGSAGVNSAGSAGGGGGGGSILFKGQTISIGSGLVSADAGNGGTGGVSNGGNGGVGRIHADYSNSFSGSSSPTIDTRVDAILSDGSNYIGKYF